MDYLTEKYDRISLWIQVWNIPPHWLSKDLGFWFCKILGKVVDVLIPEDGSKRGRHLKILVEINLENPLLRGAKLQLDGKTVWVEFRYEKLVFFCYYCGKVGHSEKSCSYRYQDTLNNKVQEGQYGDWLHAESSRIVGNRWVTEVLQTKLCYRLLLVRLLNPQVLMLLPLHQFAPLHHQARF